MLCSIVQLTAINDNPGMLYQAPHVHVHCGASYYMSNIIVASCIAHIAMRGSKLCMHAYMYRLSCKSQYAYKLSSLNSLGEGAGNYIAIATMYTSPAYVSVTTPQECTQLHTCNMHACVRI